MSADSMLMSLVRRLRRRRDGDEGNASKVVGKSNGRTMLCRGEGVGESGSAGDPGLSNFGEVISRVIPGVDGDGKLSTIMCGMSDTESARNDT